MTRTARSAPMLALLVLVACGATQDPSPEFEPVEIEVGANPHVLAAELTGDGRPDLAVAGEGRVLILAGDGKGGFRRAGEYEAGENPTGLAAFDLDRDGRTDLLVDHRSAGGLLPLHGTREGGFEPGEVVVLGGDPYRDVVVADLDGDGVLDLATPNERTVGVRLGRAGGGFGKLRELDASRVAPYGLATGDVNGDGVPDLAASSGEGGEGAAVLLGDGSGGFQPAPGTPYAAMRGFSAIEVADLDGDGRDDLAVAVTGEDRVVVLLSRGEEAIASDRRPEDRRE